MYSVFVNKKILVFWGGQITNLMWLRMGIIFIVAYSSTSKDFLNHDNREDL